MGAEHQEVWKRLNKDGDYDETDLVYLKDKLPHVLSMNEISHTAAILRTNLEVVGAIRKFDQASGELVNTTNKLTSRIYFLTWVMLGLGLVQTVFTVLGYIGH